MTESLSITVTSTTADADRPSSSSSLSSPSDSVSASSRSSPPILRSSNPISIRATNLSLTGDSPQPSALSPPSLPHSTLSHSPNPRGKQFLTTPSESNYQYRSPSSSAALTSNGYRHVSPSVLLQSSSTHCYPRSITPSQFICSSSSSSSSSSSPLPSHSVYALVSSAARNLGTPTSDIRATSVGLPSPVQQSLNPLSSPPSPIHSSTSHPQQDQLISSDQKLSNIESSVDSLERNSSVSSSDSSKKPLLNQSPQISSIGAETFQRQPQSPSVCSDAPKSDFWVILDHSLRVIFLDPTFRLKLNSKHVDHIKSQVEAVDLSSPQSNQSSLVTSGIKDHLLGHGLPQVELFKIFDDHGSSSNSAGPCNSQLGSVQWLSGDRNALKISCELVSSSSTLPLSDQASGIRPSDSVLYTGQKPGFAPVDIFLHAIDCGLVLGLFHFNSLQEAPSSPTHSHSHSHQSNIGSALRNSYGSHLLDHRQIHLLHLALSPSLPAPPSVNPQALESPVASPLSQIHFQPPSPPSDIFMILDITTGQILFNHPPAAPLSTLPSSPHNSSFLRQQNYRPEDFVRLILGSKSQPSSGAHDDPEARKILSSSQVVISEGTCLNVNTSFVIQCGNLIFAALRCSLPPYHHRLSHRSSSASSIASHISLGNHHALKPTPLELIHNHSSSIPLDLYSPNSIQSARVKRARTDLGSETITPHSASSTSQHSQTFVQNPYRRPSVNSSHPYSPYLPNHAHHHNQSPFLSSAHSRLRNPQESSSQLSPLVSNMPVPESPDAFGAQFNNFSGELSPTMASAANVLGSFHRAHYHHPQSILALQEAIHPHQLSPSSTHSPVIGYDSYGLQSLAAMAVAGSFDHPPELSPLSSSSSHQTSVPDAFSSTNPSNLASNATYRPFQQLPSKSSTIHSNRPMDHSADGLLGIGVPSGLVDYPNCSKTDSNYGNMVSEKSRLVVPSETRSVSSGKRGRTPSTESSPQKSTLARSTSASAIAATKPLGIAAGAVAAVRSCTSCGVQNSPEWRKGPNGVKSLCNACGLRFSRAQARKSKQCKSNLNFNGGHNKKAGGAPGSAKKKIVLMGIINDDDDKPSAANGISKLVKASHHSLTTAGIINTSNDKKICS
ncbi:expressed protein [Phakopsora pachyrhizi]|uniref:Expressed protein n=1 Tax=Phakopsora pachyrhizi TaxID=170000 RepID=A0AAV0BSK0_PHAPC|nr:expressed protein [Phakopsora pachyrhizi]